MAKQHKKLSIAVAETQNQSTQIQQPAQEYREETAKLAYNLWQARGCPIGSPEEDWFAAERETQVRLQAGTPPRKWRERQVSA